MLKKFLNLFKSEPPTESPVKKQPALNSGEVATFYNNNTDKFLEVYGEIIQAFRTNNVYDYLDYTIQNAELKDGQKILDAGCAAHLPLRPPHHGADPEFLVPAGGPESAAVPGHSKRPSGGF